VLLMVLIIGLPPHLLSVNHAATAH
jgi:hypothetical protein